jgi:hypothetical protein
MGWEVRRGKRYYYRKKRVNGRVRSIYFGSGGRAFLAAQEDAERRRCATLTSQKKKAAQSCATAGKGAAFDLFRVPVDEIPAEKLSSYYILIRAEVKRQHSERGWVDTRTRTRLDEIERRGRELTRDIPSPYLSDSSAALQSKLSTLSLRILLARMKSCSTTPKGAETGEGERHTST